MPPLGVGPTPWEVLGVPEGSSPAIVRTAWRRAVRSYHPDHVGGGDIDKFHAVNEAYRELEAGFGQLRGTHPVEVGDLSDIGPMADAAGAGADDDAIFDFLDGGASASADTAPAADADPIAAPVQGPTIDNDRPAVPDDDPDAVFEAAIDRLLGEPPKRSWRARRPPAAAPNVVRVERRQLEAPDIASDPPEPSAPSALPTDAPEPPARRGLAERAPSFERPQLSPATVAGAASAVGFVAWRSAFQAVFPGAFAVPLGVLVLAGAVVGSLCWFVTQRLGADEHPTPAFAAVACAVVILGAVDILLLVAVPILLVVAVAYAVIHQRRSR